MTKLSTLPTQTVLHAARFNCMHACISKDAVEAVYDMAAGLLNAGYKRLEIKAALDEAMTIYASSTRDTYAKNMDAASTNQRHHAQALPLLLNGFIALERQCRGHVEEALQRDGGDSPLTVSDQTVLPLMQNVVNAFTQRLTDEAAQQIQTRSSWAGRRHRLSFDRNVKDEVISPNVSLLPPNMR